MASNNALIPLTEYQRNWVNDTSRFKIGVITRQGGKSFSTALETVLDSLDHKTTWVLLSAGERQSKELMGKAAMHARAANAVIEEVETDFWVDKDTKYNQLEIRFPNGSRIVGLPANPDTARGWSANLILDEFALHKDSREIWKALFPSVTRGFKLRVISTFKGKTNKFYELFFSAPTLQLWTGPDYEHVGDRSGWSKHLVSIHHACAMGLELKDEEGRPIEPEDLRIALNDDDAWAEEYECVPSDEVSAFLSHDLISSVEDAKLRKSPHWAEKLIEMAEMNHAEYLRTKIKPPLPQGVLSGVEFPGDLYVGMDIGRRKDLSVIWVDLKLGPLVTAAVIELNRKPYFVQEQILHTILGHPRFRRACIDRSGIGDQLAEGAQDRFGAYRVEGIPFTQGGKEALAVGLKQNFEDRGSLIPADSVLRNSLHSVKKYATSTGHFRFDAEKTEETGHADHFWAKALVVQAASGTGAIVYGGSDPGEEEEWNVDEVDEVDEVERVDEVDGTGSVFPGLRNRLRGLGRLVGRALLHG